MLERLDLSNCPSLVEVPDLSNLQNLKELFICEWDDLTEIRGLEELKSLELLNISKCSPIEQLPDLSNLKNLKIYVSDCEKLTKIGGLEELMKSVELLDVSGCNSLENLPYLPNTKIWAEIPLLVGIRGACLKLLEILAYAVTNGRELVISDRNTIAIHIIGIRANLSIQQPRRRGPSQLEEPRNEVVEEELAQLRAKTKTLEEQLQQQDHERERERLEREKERLAWEATIQTQFEEMVRHMLREKEEEKLEQKIYIEQSSKFHVDQISGRFPFVLIGTKSLCPRRKGTCCRKGPLFARQVSSLPHPRRSPGPFSLAVTLGMHARPTIFREHSNSEKTNIDFRSTVSERKVIREMECCRLEILLILHHASIFDKLLSSSSPCALLLFALTLNLRSLTDILQM
ncbi:hypothetical protein LguiB_013182 [Lonicera macranthoides]